MGRGRHSGGYRSNGNSSNNYSSYSRGSHSSPIRNKINKITDNYARTRYNRHIANRYGITNYNYTSSPNYQKYTNNFSNIAKSVIFLLIFLVGGFIFLTVGNLFNSTVNNAVYEYETVSGTCNDNTYLADSKTGIYYWYSTYTYTINGTTYTEMSQVGWDSKQTIGETVTLCYKIDYPSFILENEAASDFDIDVKPDININAMFIIAGISLFIAVILLFSILNKRKQLKRAQIALDQEIQQAQQNPNIETNSIYTQTSSNDFNDSVFEEFETTNPSTVKAKKKCAYCGSFVDADLDKCPNCSAPLN